LLEEVEDQNSNPWNVALYEVGAKIGTTCNEGSTGNVGNSINPYPASWAQFTSTLPTGFQLPTHIGNPAGGYATFDDQSMCANDHPYPALARAAGSFLPGVTSTCSQGACTGTAAWNWLKEEVPYYTHIPADGSSTIACASGNDVQGPVALVDRAPAAGSSGVSIGTNVKISGVKIQ